MISLSNVCYLIGQKTILNDLSFDIGRGERIAIIGANGSGKSTLVKLMAGLLEPSEGTVSIDSVSTSDKKYKSQRGKTIGFVFQNPEHQMISINVERELALGLENLGFQTDQIHERVKSQIDKFNFGHLLNLPPTRLSGGEKQSLALASAMIVKPKVLILDEPLSHLDKAGKELFRSELKRLIDDKITIVHVTLDLIDILGFNRILVLVNGKIVQDCKPADLLKSHKRLDEYKIELPFSERMKNLNHDAIKQVELAKPNPVSTENKSETNSSLSCRGINFGWCEDDTLLSDLSLDLNAGMVYGLLGPSGCGKTTLAMILAGLLKPNNGEILLDCKSASRQDLIRQVSYIFQAPERAMFASNLYDDIAYGPRNFGFKEDEVELQLKKAFEKVGLDYELYKDRSPFSLSGGEARLAAIAGGLASDKKIVILDEPNEELDYPGRQSIKELIRNLASESRTVIVISHDSDFLFAICDYICLWSDNKLALHDKDSLYNDIGVFDKSRVEVPFVLKYAQENSLIEQFGAMEINSVYHPFILENIWDNTPFQPD
jgi:energy-coupling factor transport system permease/ATP-binding protein